MSGHWPPEWDDQDTENLDPDNLDPELEAQLAEVAAFLASVPGSVLPPVVEARISAAIAAEAQSPGPRSEVTDLSAFARRTRWRRLQSGLKSGKVLVPVAACLVLAVAGYFASLATDSSGKMSPDSAAASAAVTAGGTSGAGSSAFGASRAAPAEASSPMAGREATAGAANEAPGGEPSAAVVPFVVTTSGTKYAAATLAAQARAELAGYASIRNAESTPGAPVTSAPASSAVLSGPQKAFALPSAGLLGCVEHLTGGSRPRLVDRGTYRGTPVYVIVGESKVWVVGLGCTASHPDVLASAALTG